MTTQLNKYVAKRHVATREDPTAAPIILGFVKARSMTEAAEAATLRWGCGGENELMVLIPVNRATDFDLRCAFLAEADERFGQSFGKRKRVECPCGSINYIHPKVPMRDVDVQCMDCHRPLHKYPWSMVDMAREYEALKGQQAK